MALIIILFSLATIAEDDKQKHFVSVLIAAIIALASTFWL
jgi:hypothetical protein